MNKKNLTIGLFGFGCVGYGLYEVLSKTPGLKASIKKICVKDPDKKRVLTENQFTFDKNDLLNDDEINMIVELIDDSAAAFEIVSTALKKGKAVVTANKKMIAEHFNELLELQKKYNAPLLYEGACCASIPIIRNLEEYYDNDLLESIEGIVNGSTNYILTKTSEENMSYPEALKEAQLKGYAESNPVLDTGGFDAKFKLLILIAHAFGVVFKPDDIFNIGIDNIGELELIYAREKQFKIKLVAYAERSDGGTIISYVLPKFINSSDKLFSVDDVFNGIKTKSCFSDIQFFVGKGAGAYPTASAVISDISALSYGYKYEYKKLRRTENQQDTEGVFLKVFLRFKGKDPARIQRKFIKVEETFLNQESGYVVGVISFGDLKRIIPANNSDYSCILFERVDLSKLDFNRREPEIELRDVFI
jgi:homoserine dehydrogenase